MKNIFFLGLFLVSCGKYQEPVSFVRSLTDEEFTGKKYYFGFGRASWEDPDSMYNEVRYDIKHTHDIFTKDIGGNYNGKYLNGSSAGRTSISNSWSDYDRVMLNNDMYVQYSAGHGDPEGLEVGFTYDEIRDRLIRFPAKEMIIFIMSCESGGLVEAFNRIKSRWQEWGSYGRTLLVMSSSGPYEDSATGPGTSSDEPGGPYGSAGSAFGYSLWQAMLGKADGYGSGVTDGFLSLQEITQFTIQKTRNIGGHTPQLTGVYNGNLIMNRVPSRAYVEEAEANRLVY